MQLNFNFISYSNLILTLAQQLNFELYLAVISNGNLFSNLLRDPAAWLGGTHAGEEQPPTFPPGKNP